MNYEERIKYFREHCQDFMTGWEAGYQDAIDEVAERIRGFSTEHNIMSLVDCHMIETDELVEKQGKKGTNGNEREIPFLAWSEEDERIRKEIINFLEHYPNIIVKKERRNDWIAWLEKQAEHKKFRDGIQIGDKVTRNKDGVLVNLSQLNRVAKKDEKQGEQNPAWSEEDETALDDALWCCKQAASIAKDENDMGNVWYAEYWLKSLKDRVQSQPKQEWSEEDDDDAWLNDIISKAEYNLQLNKGEINWLKSLKDRYTWKPSDEQVKALNYVINLMASSESPKENDYYYNVFKGLREQLMKLRGE